MQDTLSLSAESLAQRLKAEQAGEICAPWVRVASSAPQKLDGPSKWLIIYLVLVVVVTDVQCACSNLRLRFQVCNATNPKLTGATMLMLIRKSQDFLRAMFISSLLFALPQGAFAQEQTQPAGKPSANANKKSKPGADSCDGALDIVPGKSMTFTRKRRSSKPETKSEAKPETKPEAKPEAKSEAKPETKPEPPNHQ